MPYLLSLYDSTTIVILFFINVSTDFRLYFLDM